MSKFRLNYLENHFNIPIELFQSIEPKSYYSQIIF